MLTNETHAGGLELHFFDSADFETPQNKNSPEESAVIARNALRMLMMGWRSDWKKVLSWRVFKAIFIKRDHELLRGMRLAFQQGFSHIFKQLEFSELSPAQCNQAQLFISNCLAFLPFSDITPYESFAIPQWIDNKWQLIEYKVVPIELTPHKGLQRVVMEDGDRVFAYGLEPLTNRRAQPHLIFMGTTYPAGQGFHTQINTDLEGFETPGKFLYRASRDKIKQWLDRQRQKVHVCGISLGGALSLLLAIDQGEKLARVDALNPPGLYEPWRKSRFDHWDELEEKPQVFIQKQANDRVSGFGIWKKEWRVLHVLPPEAKKGPNSLVDHAINYAGFAETKFIEIDAILDNHTRKKRNFWFYTFIRGMAYYLGHVPYRYLALPIARYNLSHKFFWGLLSVVVLTCILVPPLVHFFGLAALLLIAATPLVVYLAYKLNNALKVWLGAVEVQPPRCHHFELPRNKTMDIYSNDIEEEFSYQEIGAYYEASRCLLKNKPFLPEPTKVSKSTFFSGLGKYEVLKKSRSENSHEKITVKASKGKIYHMKEVIRLKMNFFNSPSERLQDLLQERQQMYRLERNHYVLPRNADRGE